MARCGIKEKETLHSFSMLTDVLRIFETDREIIICDKYNIMRLVLKAIRIGKGVTIGKCHFWRERNLEDKWEYWFSNELSSSSLDKGQWSILLTKALEQREDMKVKVVK